MVITLGFLISFAAGWSIVAADALFRAEERPGMFQGTPGMILLLVVAGVGGADHRRDVRSGCSQSLISAAVLVILAGGTGAWAAPPPRSCTSMPPATPTG